MEYSISYSIIVVCLNAGKRLMETIESIRSQTYGKYEIIIKDGMSTDGSLDSLIQEADRGDSRIRIHSQADKGIYDAMNQAVGYAKGDYLFFLNAGDSFYDKEVLYKITEVIERDKPDIVYGDPYHRHCILWYSQHRQSMILPVTGMCHVIRPVSIVRSFLQREDTTLFIMCVLIMNISCGVIIKEEQPLCMHPSL